MVLRARGCTEVQGYCLGRPMPASEVTKLLAKKASPIVAGAS